MANIRKWLEDAERHYGEQIEAVVVGKHYRNYGPNGEDEFVLLPRDTGLAKLDEEFNDGFGGADCYPMYAWTASSVWFIHEYYGATSLNCVPRNPMACEPEYGGTDFDLVDMLRNVG